MGDEFVAKRGERPIVRGYAFDRNRLVLDLETPGSDGESSSQQLLIELLESHADPSSLTMPARFLPASERIEIEPEYQPLGDAEVELEFGSAKVVWRPDEIARQFVGRGLYKVFRNAPLLFVYIEGLDVLMLEALRDIDSGCLVLHWEFSD
ncbi:MAG: hypothetical protein AAFV77_00095 [Planctomycetota bacterium]